MLRQMYQVYLPKLVGISLEVDFVSVYHLSQNIYG